MRPRTTASSRSALPDQPPTKVLTHDRCRRGAPGPHENPCAHAPPPRHLQVGTAMNDSLDLHEITTVVAVALDDSENGADERGWWPVLALTDEAHPIVLE